MRFIKELSVSTTTMLAAFSLNATTTVLDLNDQTTSSTVLTSTNVVPIVAVPIVTLADQGDQTSVTSVAPSVSVPSSVSVDIPVIGQAGSASVTPSTATSVTINPVISALMPIASTVTPAVSVVSPLPFSTDVQASASLTVATLSPIATPVVIAPVVVTEPTVTQPVSVVTPVTVYDPADYNHDGKVTLGEEIKYIGEEFTKGVKSIFGNHKVSKTDLKNIFSKDNWNKIKHYLDYDGNGSISFTDIQNDIKVTLSDVKEHAQHFRKFILGYKEQLTNNALFVLLPAEVQQVINKILNFSQDVANNVANGATIAINTSGNLEQEMSSLSTMITSGQIDTAFLAKNKVYLSNLVQVINQWKASGNTSQAATTIVNYLKNIK